MLNQLLVVSKAVPPHIFQTRNGKQTEKVSENDGKPQMLGASAHSLSALTGNPSHWQGRVSPISCKMLILGKLPMETAFPAY